MLGHRSNGLVLDLGEGVREEGSGVDVILFQSVEGGERTCAEENSGLIIASLQVRILFQLKIQVLTFKQLI